ncbi:MAG: polyphosphate kinase 2 [Ilumatobacteraceae bacterium]
MNDPTGHGHGDDGFTAVELEQLIDALQADLTADEFVERGLSVEGTFDEIDDPVLIGPNGSPIKTWMEGYPYEERMSRHEYEATKRLLQIELLKLQAWLQQSGHKVCIVFEGRDAAGKGGTIKRFMEHLNPRLARVVALGIPTEREQGQWYFQRWIEHLPTRGELVLFDRSWYTRAVVDRVMGYCTPDQHVEFLRHVPEFERSLQASDMTVIKLWFSVSRKEQVTRFTIRRIDPVRQWKLSPSDLASLDRWHDYTVAKESMFLHTDTTEVPWTVVRSNDKKRGRVEAMRSVLARFDYPEKNAAVVGVPDPLIVGPPALVGADAGELER